MMNIKHIFQPNGISCGPTCLKMAKDYIDDYPNDNQSQINYFSPTVENIIEMCGTNSIVGTPPEKMRLGMQKLYIDYIEYQFSPKPYELLRQVIDSKHIPILRTITMGIPHWILVRDYDEKFFYVNDPWLGEIKYSEKQLDKIWKTREYQFFEIINK